MQLYHLSMWSRQLSQLKYVQACKGMFGKKTEENLVLQDLVVGI